MEEGHALLLAAFVSFLVGVLLILLIITLAVVVLWKCGIRLDKRANSPLVKDSDQSDAALGEAAEPQSPDEAEQCAGTDRRSQKASLSSPPGSGHRVRTSSRSRRVLTSFRRRSRKAISDPLGQLRSGYRKARCVSLGTHLEGYGKLSALVDCIEPYLGSRPLSLWTASDDSIVFENPDYLILIPRNRRKPTTHCQEPHPPQTQSPSEPNAATAQRGTHVNPQCPSKPPKTDGTAGARTTRVQHLSRQREEHGVTAKSSAPLFGQTSNGLFAEKDEEYQQMETSSDGLSMESELESETVHQATGSDQSTDRKMMNSDFRPYVGRARTATTKTFTFSSSYNGFF